MLERDTVDCLPTSLSSLCPASPHEWVRTCSSQESRPQHSESHGRRNHRQPRSYRRPCRTRPVGTCVLGLATGAAPSCCLAIPNAPAENQTFCPLDLSRHSSHWAFGGSDTDLLPRKRGKLGLQR